jgi:hypothetical protein
LYYSNCDRQRLLFLIVVNLNSRDCFRTNQTYLIVSILIMAGLKPEKRFFFLRV